MKNNIYCMNSASGCLVPAHLSGDAEYVAAAFRLGEAQDVASESRRAALRACKLAALAKNEWLARRDAIARAPGACAETDLLQSRSRYVNLAEQASRAIDLAERGESRLELCRAAHIRATVLAARRLENR
jgi:hypothetical protein